MTDENLMQNGQSDMGTNQSGAMGAGTDKKKVCRCPHHKATPILIILIGLTFLLGDWGFFNAFTATTIWSILLIIIGIFQLTKKKCACC
ncbi:MAG: LiaF transmembrane domain-containing protein [Candidatus Saccharimonadales bacterium]